MVQATDNDANGIDITALELNGSTLKFNQSGLLTDCNITTVTSQNFSGVKIDMTAPTISDFNLVNLPGLYNSGEKINFTMTFSEAVYVIGTPKFSVSLDSGGPVDAVYVAGSGSTLLSFQFTVASNHTDTNGYNGITSPLDVGAGSIKDVVGNTANLDFPALIANVLTASASVGINGQLPYVVDIEVPANGTYVANNNLDVTLNFDRNVTVSGSPYVGITIGANLRQATYLSGSGTSAITFRYTAVPGDVDTDGITIQTTVTQNAGNIVDAAAPAVSYFTAGNNSYIVPANSILVNAIQPRPTSLARNVDTTIPIWGGTSADNVWIIGQEILFTVGFNTGIFVTQTNGTPGLSIAIGATAREANYLSGGNGQTSLVFRYIIQEGDLDSDGSIGIGNIVLNNGVITDSANTNSLLTMPVATLANTRIDGVKPVISSVTAPASGTYSTIAPLAETNMTFTANWSEAVNYSAQTAGAAYLSLDIGGVSVNADYVSGNNTSAIIHRPASLAGRNDSNGITVSSPLAGTAVIKDQAGNTGTVKTFAVPNTAAILVDTTAPTVTSVIQSTANGTYRSGQNLNFTVTFNESVTTVADTTYPRIAITIGATTRYLVATASTTNTTHTFRYTIQSGDFDSDGVVLGTSVESNGTVAYARDGGRNNVTGTFTPPTTTALLVDAIGPTISSRTPSVAKAYVSGDVLQISLTYSEAVIVDTVSGTPSITMDFDQGTDNLAYTSGSGTTTLVFSRTIAATHFDMTGLPASVSTVTLNNGTIKDVTGNDASLMFTALDMSGHSVTYPEVKLWVKSGLTNLAPPTGAAGISSTGVATTSACGTGICRDFDGDDSLLVSAPMNGIDSVLMACRTPASLGNYDIFDNSITLTWDGVSGSYDLLTSSATLVLNNVSMGTNVTFDANLPADSTHVIQVTFQASENFPNGALVPSLYRGGIGEIVAISGTLTATQLDNIRNYLDGKF